MQLYSTETNSDLLCFPFIFPDETLFFAFAVLGLELKAYTLSLSTSPFFVIGFFKMGSHEVFAQAGFKP
jgi:hypothetical protein